MVYCNRVFNSFVLLKAKFSDTPKYVCTCLFECSRNYCTTKFVPKKQMALKSQLFTMKVDTPHFKSCLTEEVKYVRDLFIRNGYDIRIVGGAVRDLLLGHLPHDLDFATTATPEEMKKMFLENEIRMISETGEKHGTITTRINEVNLEITTLRVDRATDGRHAEVEFTKDWELDASRRDLTINAMFLDFEGNLYDYFSGYEDLKNSRVVFVGDAACRIQEDYLRILRYFRFYGRIATRPDNHDQDVIKAIQENKNGLSKISGERIWMELNKILTGNFAGELLQEMIRLGIGPYVGLPKNCNEEELMKVWNRLKFKNVAVRAMTLLSSVFESEDEVTEFYQRVKLSNLDRDLGYFIVSNRNDKDTNPLRLYKHYIIFSSGGSTSVKTTQAIELLKYRGKFELIDELKNWQIPKFPVHGESVKIVLAKKGITNKRKIGVILNKLREIWFECDFKLTAEELLGHIPGIIESPDFDEGAGELKR